jgi:hypothetical protein
MERIRDTSIDPDLEGKVGNRFKDIKEGAEGAQDAVHSMAGNAIGDFAATTSGIGPLGEALGQLTEKALQGGQGFKALATAGLGLGAISAGMLVLNKVMGEFAKTSARQAALKAFDDAEVKSFTAAVKNGSTATEVLNKRLADTDKLMVTVTSTLDNFGTGWKTNLDISDVMKENGVTVKLLGAAIEGGETGINNLKAALEAAGVSQADVTKIISAARHELELYRQGQDIAAKTALLSSGASLEVANSAALSAEAQRYAGQAAAYQAEQETKAAQATAAHAAAMEANAAATQIAADNQAAAEGVIEGVNAVLEEQAAAWEADAAAAKALSDQLTGQVDAMGAAVEAQEAANASLRTFAAVAKDGKSSGKDVADAAWEMSEATAENAEAQAAANGQILTTTEKLDAQNGSLLAAAASTKKGRGETLDYIFALNKIPPDKQTEIRTLLDEGKVAEAQAKIDEASVARDVALNADANARQAEIDLDKAAEDRDMMISASANTSQAATALNALYAKYKYMDVIVRGKGGIGIGAEGGIAGPNGMLIAEAGPEFAKQPGRDTELYTTPIIVPQGTRVTSTRKTRQILQRRQPKRYATGTQMPAPVNTGGHVFNFNQTQPIYGVNDLWAEFNKWGRQVAAQINAGKR